VLSETRDMEKEGEHWEMREHSEDLLVAFKEFFGQEAEVDVPMNTEAENVITVIAGQDDGALGAWGKVMSGVVGPDDVSEMLRVAFYEAGLPVESVDTACSVTPLNMRRLEALMDKGFGGDGEGSLGSYPDLKWVYKCADIEIKIEIGGVELKMPAKLRATGAGQMKVFTGVASMRTERQQQAKANRYVNTAIDSYIEQAKPFGACNSGKPRVIHSSLETGPNGRKVNIVQMVFANVAQALKVAGWTNLLGTGKPALDIWPPGVRKTQTSETQLSLQDIL
jgi:hypothetical protein